MPELPDVETFRRYVGATALHQRVSKTRVTGRSLLKGTTPAGLGRALHGRTFEKTDRHGKYLFIALDSGGWLVLHFGMTGELHYYRHDGKEPDYTQFLVSFGNDYELAYSAPRKLGRISLADSPPAFVAAQGLGPDALTLDEKTFMALLAGSRGSLKPWLMDQKKIAGIGNVYSDEILFQARLHPGTAAARLDRAAQRRLFRAMHTVLEKAIKAGAQPERMPRSFLLPRREKGGRCPKCGTGLATTRAGGRTAWYCPRCQKK